MYLTLERYSRPQSIEECLRLWQAGRAGAALLAGGTDLNARGHERLVHVIDLQALALDGVRKEGATLRVGARLTLGRLRRTEELSSPGLRALVEAASAYANRAVQNRSTLGGRIVVDRADQDVPPALAALGARLRLARLVGDRVEESTIDYPLGSAARQALAGALVTEILLPADIERSALRRMGRTAVDVPLATCAAALHKAEVRLSANVQGPGAADLRRLSRTEAAAKAWVGSRPADWREKARALLLEDLNPWQDPWASGEYRRDLSATLALRALAVVLGEPELSDGEKGRGDQRHGGAQ